MSGTWSGYFPVIFGSEQGNVSIELHNSIEYADGQVKFLHLHMQQFGLQLKTEFEPASFRE